jgi:raffinose/stachyose/melibiose transport system permease protein
MGVVGARSAAGARQLAGRLTRRRKGGPRRASWWLALPSVAFLVAYHFVAPLSAVWYAFTDWNGLGVAKWVGLDNFRQILRAPETRGALIHTLELAAALLVIANVLGCALALALNRSVKSRHILRSLFFLPAVVSPLATAYVWQYIFTYDGALNRFLGFVGLDGWQKPWLGDPTWALWTILVVLVWQFSGLTMIIYLAGLQGIPAELDEAAAVDGASTWFRLRKITLPMLAPALTVAATLSLIFGLRVFDQVLALTAGGPVGATETLATQVWQQTFAYGRFGYGAALSLVLAGLVAVLAIGQLMVLRRREQML